MDCFKIRPSSLLILTTLMFAVLAFFPTKGAGYAAEDGAVLGIRRSILAGSNGGNSSSLVLAAERTRRKDPENGFSYYTGGWNISNSHYLYSVLGTGIPLILAAIIWFVVFGIFLLLACMCMCCCRRRQYGYSRTAYALSLILLSIFTIAAAIGSAVLYTGQGKFHNTTKDTLNYVLEQAETTAGKLKEVSSFLSAAKNIGILQSILPPDVENSIDNVNNVISTAANQLHNVTQNNKNDIFSYLDAAGTSLVVVAAVMLVLVVLGFLLSILGLQFLVYILVVIGWILVAVTFILCGIFLVLHNVVGDTCVAMNEWVANPTAHTALDDIIPCVDPTVARQSLSESREVTFQLVRLVNGVISNVSNRNLPPNAAPLYYNQSGPLVPALCNPYNPDKTNRTCVSGEVDLTNATQVWRNYECQVSSNNICTNVGRLTPTLYNQMSSAVNVSYGLYHYGPFMVDLVDCTFVRETFTKIENEHCPNLRRYSYWVYIGLLIVSAAVLLSLILWLLYARERRHRKYTQLMDSNSGQPSSSFESKGRA